MGIRIIDVLYKWDDEPEEQEPSQGQIVYVDNILEYQKYDSLELAEKYGIDDDKILFYTDTLNPAEIKLLFDLEEIEMILPYD